MPHGHCYLWKPGLVALHFFSDLFISLAYFSIPLIIIYFLRKRKDFPFPKILFLFAAFILCCGITHTMEIWNIWNSSYYTAGVLKMLTAIVSVATVVALFPLIPKVLQLKSPSELKKINDELRLANEKAHEAIKMKNSFLANVSHEIRTPMNGILGLTNVMLDGKLDSEQEENLDLIKKSANSLLSIINDILDFSKLEAGKISIESSRFDITQLINEIYKFFLPQFKAKGVDFKLIINDQCPRLISADSDIIRQIANNLISNAYKYTNKGHVTLTLDYIDHNFRLMIDDEGVGVSKDKQDQLFQPFSQLHNKSEFSMPGTGLGLSISKKLAALLQGDIKFQDKAGPGSIFILNFKADLVEENLENSIPNVQEYKNQNIENIKRILLAEDNQINQQVIIKMLKDYDVVFDVCADGSEALDLFRKFKYDIVLMDYQMPIMNGLNATKKIREFEQQTSAKCGTPIIGITADALSDTISSCLKAGMNDVLTKPISKAQIINLLSKYS